MPILFTEHVQSNAMLANAVDTQVSVCGNRLAFEVTFNDKEDATCVFRWYKPTARKFFYTLCKKNIDRIWKHMKDLADEKEEDASGLALLLLDSWNKNNKPGIAKKLRFNNIVVQVPKPYHIFAHADMQLFFYDFDTVEIVDFVPQHMTRNLIVQLEEQMKIMMLDASNYGIKSGHIGKFTDLL